MLSHLQIVFSIRNQLSRIGGFSVGLWLLLAIVSGLTVTNTRPVAAQEIGFIEDFVLAQDREKVLKQLVPGTEQYYYFHALHYQTNQQLDKVDELLQPWIKRTGETALVKQIQNRQALLRYSDNPEQTLAYLTKTLNLDFNHQREIPRTQRELPSKLDPKLTDEQVLFEKALASDNGTGGFTEFGLRLLVSGDASKLSPSQRRNLLQRLSHPDFPSLVELIHADLQTRDSGGFGSLPIHSTLTPEQLEQLSAKDAKLKSNTQFVTTYLSKLQPSEDVNWMADNAQRRAYLGRLWDYVQNLNPTFNSLKASVLYRQLELDLEMGQPNRATFMAYLALPRNANYCNPEVIRQLRARDTIADLRANYWQQIKLMPISQDEPLVREYLHYFLRDSDNFDAFRPFIRDAYLQEQFATVKILNGIGDPERWASRLTPDQYKALVDRTDLEFVSTNPGFFDVDDEVELGLQIKNVKNLIVKVFEINTENYYRKYKKEIDTDINLDGLVPNFEDSYNYDEPPAIVNTRSFKFPQLDKRGVFVVDFIAGGKSSRALIRKGRMQFTSRVTPVGQQFTIVDQSGEQIKDATLWIAGARYQPAEDGTVLIPFTTQPGPTDAVITHNGFSSFQRFEHVAENYNFKAALVLDRESLTRGNQARVLIRPSLQVAGRSPVPVSVLENAKLVISTTNLDGVAATKTIENLEFSNSEETICEFVVPPRLSNISLQLTAELACHSRSDIEKVSAAESYVINQIDQSDAIEDIHLIPTENGYFLELLGKTGELRKSQAVRVTLTMAKFNQPVTTDLQTNSGGLIELGPLPNVLAVDAQVIGGPEKNWQLNTQDQTYYRTLHASVGQVIELPAPAGVVAANRSAISLLERRGGTYVRDWFDSVSVQDGLIQLAGLPAGDFELLLRYLSPTQTTQQQAITIRVTAGKLAGNVLIGEDRHLETRGNQQLHISTVTTGDEKIRIELDNVDSTTRLHLIATRYQPAFNAFQNFAQIRDVEPAFRRQSIRRSVYLEGRKIGDEYEYILRRKYAAKYPGNMLERPSLLLNPWEVQTTSNSAEDAKAGTKFGEVGNEADEMARRQASEGSDVSGKTDFANLDFLSGEPVLVANLKPSENGVVTIDRNILGDRNYFRVIALNAFNTIEREVSLPMKPIAARDRRLAKSLDANGHFSLSKQTQVMKPGEALLIEDVISAKFQQYDDLGDVFRLLETLNPGTPLAKFRFILQWNQQSNEDKQKLYSEHACHELNFFLLKKDPDFFNEVVRPHLEFKHHKTFLDLWLLKANLEEFADPWQYARLNTMERILLAQRLENRSTDIIRNVNEAYQLNPTERAAFDMLYDTAILGLDLDESVMPESPARMLEQQKQMVMSDAAMGGGLGGGGGGRGPAGMGGRGFAFGRSMVPPALPAPPAGANSRQPYTAYADKSLERKSTNGRADGLVAETATESLSGLSRKGGSGLLGGIGFDAQGIRTETRTRVLPDGTTQSYTVQVPVTELGQTRDEAEPESNLLLLFDKSKLEELRKRSRQLYRRLAPTKEWMENNYFQLLPDQQTPELVLPNRFWRDYANHDSAEFLSPYFVEANRTFTEMMFALAVLDLPLEAPEQQLDFAENSLKVTAKGPTIAFHQQVRDALVEQGNTSILVSENFFQKNDRFRFEDGQRFDKFISGDFLAHTLYGSQVVITNPTSTPRAVDLLIQIPQGAIACSGAQETRTIQINLEAFSTQTFEYAFYFPMAGDFEHYPAHVAADEKVLAMANGATFKVIEAPATVDKSSWQFVSQNGTEAQVLEFLNTENVLRLDLNKIAFRMQDKKFFQRAIETLRNRYVFADALWAYAVKHNDPRAMQEFLANTPAISGGCGLAFESQLLTLNPVDRNWYQHKEYWPLVNERIHSLTPQRKILNPNFFAQYQNLLGVLSNRRELSNDDHLLVAYYMLLQDRIENAIEHFEKVSRDQTAGKIQYDYCDAYLDLYREVPAAAAKKAEQWKDYPVDLWRNRFRALLAQVAEIEGGQVAVVDEKANDQRQTKLAATSESFDFDVESGVAKIKFQNLKALQANFYEMDIELLFSRSPFAQNELDGFSMIRPNLSKTIELEMAEASGGKSTSFDYPLPAEMKNKNVLVELVAGDQTKSQPYFAHSIDLRMFEKFGQLQVADEDSGKVLPKTYVKVYAKLQDGSVRFHKDGYTDLRGRFDYVSQSNRTLDGVKELSLLILSDANGAMIRQTAPPKE